MFKSLNQKGQALLIVVLAMVVALTIGLSVVSRSIINLRNSQQEIDSQKSLSAAEAGAEQAIKNGTSITQTNNFSSQTSYQTSSAVVSGDTTFLLNGNNKVSQDDGIYLWLTPYSNSSALFQTTWSGDLNIYWGNSSTVCNNAALEITVISGSRTTPTVTRFAYDPCSPDRSANDRTSKNHFTEATVASPSELFPGPGITLLYSATIPIKNGLLVRATPLYADSYIGASSAPDSPALPSQGNIITSTGTTDNNVVRKIVVFQGYPEVPAELFPFSLFSP